tara:strand:- start:42 stop:329 length:288 start_codon:yes stop_codon:yes gene_type:complete
MSYTANVTENATEYCVELMNGSTVGETHNLPKNEFEPMTILGVIVPWIATSGYTDETVNDSNYVMPENFVSTYIVNSTSVDLDTLYNTWRDSVTS